MNDSPGGSGRFLRRIVDGVEEAVEESLTSATRAVDRLEDKAERELRDDEEPHRGSSSTHRPVDGVTVNVRVNCGCPLAHCGCSSCGPREGGPPASDGTGRPAHVTGTSDHSLADGITSIGSVLGLANRPRDVWPGTRSQVYLPLLILRGNATDTGARPITGAFWESPDILIAPGVDPAHAPAVPDLLGAVADAGKDNTIYAHVWNLGQAPSPETLVEFYWFNPSLGFSGDQAHLIGATWVNLGARGQRDSHRLVRCPESWHAQYLNGGHECLVARVSQSVLDPLSGPAWDASRNRHVGQRNIHVMTAAEAAAHPTLPIVVGPLFGGIAQVTVVRADTATMPWLHLVTMDRATLPATGAATGDLGLTPPTPAGMPLPDLGAVPDPRGAGLLADTHAVTGDGQQVGFHATDEDPGAGKAHVYRITGVQDGSVFGGYTIVVIG